MSYKSKINNIDTFIFDVDGVLTDGSVYLLNDEVGRVLNSRDGYALQYAAKLSYNIFVITGGNSESVKKRLLGLGVTEVILKAKNKIDVYELLKKKYSFKDENVLYMGDDIPDYNVMKQVGVATCPQDAAVEIKAISDYQSPYNGGRHCVRDVIEQTLRVQGKWFGELSHQW
jgi:3-deoxy-D-manno-octulosonate 8-phosphate phosphatase (KDO 8-P phosphatase)